MALILNNDVLTGAALLLAYLVVDGAGSGALKRAIMVLSRLKRWAFRKGLSATFWYKV